LKALLVRLEPIIWLLFGGGMMATALLYPGWIFSVGLAQPLGVFSDSALGYDRALALATNPLGRLVIVLAIALPLWAAAHHVRHVQIDFGGVARDGWFGALCYGVALAGSALSIVAVARL
jgi:fumarate reductase subunit D